MALHPSGGNPAPSSTSNPFTSLLTASFYQTFVDAIDALLADGGCTVACTFIYSGQKFTTCNNCQGGIYRPGGPIPYPNGKLCPVCFNKKIVNSTDSETHNMAVIFDSKQWRILGRSIDCRASNTVNSPRSFAETMTRIEMYPKIKAVDYIILDSDNSTLMKNKYQRIGEPEPCGLNSMEYLITAWKKV
jgi:hypothetical protein